MSGASGASGAQVLPQISSKGNSAATQAGRAAALAVWHPFRVLQAPGTPYAVEFACLTFVVLIDRAFWERFAGFLVHTYTIPAERKHAGRALVADTAIQYWSTHINVAHERYLCFLSEGHEFDMVFSPQKLRIPAWL